MCNSLTELGGVTNRSKGQPSKQKRREQSTNIANDVGTTKYERPQKKTMSYAVACYTDGLLISLFLLMPDSCKIPQNHWMIPTVATIRFCPSSGRSIILPVQNGSDFHHIAIPI